MFTTIVLIDCFRYSMDPEEPQEGDIVNIVAKIANVGKGPNRQGF